jgi:hypothetical protein
VGTTTRSGAQVGAVRPPWAHGGPPGDRHNLHRPLTVAERIAALPVHTPTLAPRPARERCRGDNRGFGLTMPFLADAVCLDCGAVATLRPDLGVYASVDGYHLRGIKGREPDWDAIGAAFPEMAAAEAAAADAEDAARVGAEPASTIVPVAAALQPAPEPESRPYKVANAEFRAAIGADPTTVPPSRQKRDREYTSRNAARRAAYAANRAEGLSAADAAKAADKAVRRRL